MPNPSPMKSLTYKRTCPCGKMYSTVGERGGKPVYFTCDVGKAGGCLSAMMDIFGRLIGRLLKSGVDPKKIASDLIGTRCHASIVVDGEEILSCVDCVGKVLKDYMLSKESVEKK